MIARVPASSANLGPGFDTLAIALCLYLEIEADPAPKLDIIAFGEGAGFPVNEQHLGARVARHVLGHTDVRLRIRSQIPLGRGLGSSAAFAAACAAALGAQDPFSVASHFDGHSENAAASIFGGFVTATTLDSGPVSSPLAIDQALSAIAVIPGTELSTETARAVLPKEVKFSDAIFNLGRMGMLIAGFADLKHLDRTAAEDRLHQDCRTKFFKESSAIIEALYDAGALVAMWSGAGPTIIGFSAKAEAPAVAERATIGLSSLGLEHSVRVLDVDRTGLIVHKSYGSDFQPLQVASLY